MKKPTKKWQAVLAAVALIGLGMAGLRSWPPINDVRTGGTPQYPDIQPRVYALPRRQVFDAATALARDTSGWEVVSSDPNSGTIQAVSHVFLTPFIDDVTIRVTEEHNTTVVNMRSHSRVGKGDLGVNARRIRHYLRTLDERLGSRGNP